MVKVLVGCPTSDYKAYCLKEYLNSVKSLNYDNYDVLIVDNSKTDDYAGKIKESGIKVIKMPYHESARQRIIDSRNKIREEFLAGNYDYFLSLEQDIIPPRDIIQRLLAYNRDVVAGLYFTVQNKTLSNGQIIETLRPLVWVTLPDQDPNKMFYLDEKFAEKSNDFIQAYATGLGCMLISRKVLEKIKFRFEGPSGFDDVHFCSDLEKNHIPLFVDLSVKCKHNITNWCWKGIKL
ncbi:glycosyltransferase [Candidatus Woesearchaeota archaeon]|nr:glycosyltransferase [Candidatus Woesearchaeota archaeon]